MWTFVLNSCWMVDHSFNLETTWLYTVWKPAKLEMNRYEGVYDRHVFPPKKSWFLECLFTATSLFWRSKHMMRITLARLWMNFCVSWRPGGSNPKAKGSNDPIHKMSPSNSLYTYCINNFKQSPVPRPIFFPWPTSLQTNSICESIIT